MEAHEIFATSTKPWSAPEIRDRHNACYDRRKIRGSCFGCTAQLGLATESHARLSPSLLRCCRQTYLAARLIPFSANTLSFTNPYEFQSYCIFGKSLVDKKSLIRRLHLDIIIRNRWEEEGWDLTFRAIAGDLKSLQHIYIDIEQNPYELRHLSEWRFKEPAESSFLGGLRELRESNLSFVTVTISDFHILHSVSEGWERWMAQYRWTMTQKQGWAGYVKKILLRETNQDLAIGEGI